MTITADSEVTTKRDYTLTGESARQAVERGLVSAKWYHTDIDRKALRDLMERKDGPAIRDTILWLGLLALFAGVGIWLWPSWWSVPFWLAYGVLYGSAGDSRWHECGHGTAFKTKWMNRVVYQIACFCMIRNPIGWRWSHSRHHSDTNSSTRSRTSGSMPSGMWHDQRFETRNSRMHWSALYEIGSMSARW